MNQIIIMIEPDLEAYSWNLIKSMGAEKVPFQL